VPIVHRFEIRAASADREARAQHALHRARGAGFDLHAIAATRVYLIEGDLQEDELERIQTRLLTDPVIERVVRGAEAPDAEATVVEVLPKPGVMDPAAQSVREAVLALTGRETRVLTGWRYDMVGSGLTEPDAARLAERALANPVVHDVHTGAVTPKALPRGGAYRFQLREVPIRSLDPAALERASREGHLFLDLDEMRAVQEHYRRLGREPTDIELETIAQTWSEHCVHKTLKSTIRYTPADPSAEDPIDWKDRPGHELHEDGSVTIRNLLRSTVAAATRELIDEGLDWTLSVFVDNAGVIAFDEQEAVCVKVETHNHPSAIEPYGGAATGLGGCIRDIIGTGLAARPIANTDVFCVAPPDLDEVPTGCLPPRRVLEEVVAGVRDYGNRMGIPTVNGAVSFDARYVGNPLVYCGCVGIMPRDCVEGEPREGDVIVAIGGRTGRDGIHGATFSSAELTDTHADEFAHAVQIGNPIEEKRVLDAIIRARDEGRAKHGRPLFNAITDCGAGGFSSAIGEMGERLGATVELERAPLKYAGLSYTEIWISEAQERMVLAVPTEHLDALRAICEEEQVELSELGGFGTPNRELVLRFEGHEVGRLPMAFLHEGIPTPTREATWAPARGERRRRGQGPAPGDGLRERLLALLADPDIASKHWIVRQYDHEVQGNTVVKPLVGPQGIGAGDAAVIEPKPGSGRGLAIACGLQTRVGDPDCGGDPYEMALAAIDECVRNLVCVGADPSRIAILDNFCWPSCAKPQNLGSLVRAAEGCYDGAKAYRTPFVSGKDSLNNQFTTESGRTIEIPPTLLITGVGIVPDLGRCVTMDAKSPGSRILLLRPAGGSDGVAGRVATSRAVAAAVERGLVRSAHDCSEGGVLVALAEMLIAGSTEAAPIGALLDSAWTEDALDRSGFEESPARYLLEIAPDDEAGVGEIAGSMDAPVEIEPLATLDRSGLMRAAGAGGEIPVAEMTEAWRGTLDW